MVNHSQPRKGAFQLSLGFIIGVVFAIVVLSLAVIWIQDLMGGVTDISEGLKEEASLKLEETFQETDENYAIWPTRKELTAGTKLAVSAGLKNNAMDGERHKFLVNIQPQSLPTGVTDTEVMSWIEWAKQSKTVNPNQNTNIPIYITVPHGAQSGTYIFRITGCSECSDPRCPPGGGTAGTITSSMCTPDSDYVWGASAEDFILVIE